MSWSSRAASETFRRSSSAGAPRRAPVLPATLRAGLLAALPAALLAGCGGPEPAPPPEPVGGAVTVLAQGGPLHGSNGIMFGPDGRLYVASVVSSEVAAIDPETGEVLDRWGEAEGVNGPDDLAFGPDGSLYWTDIAGGDVGRRTPDGTAAVVASPGPGVNPITFSDDGRLFVSQCFLGDKLFEVDPDGAEEPRLISDQLGPGCGLNGMDWGPDGKLYGPRWFRNEVARVDVDSGMVETVASGFGIPAAVKFDSEGRLHILDTQAGEVVRVDVATGEKEVVGRPGVGLDNLALDADDRLFVSSFTDGSIVEVTGPETIREVMRGGVNSPGGLAWLAADGGAGRLFVADGSSLRELDPVAGATVHVEPSIVSEVGQAMSAHPHGDHLVLSGGGMVTLWDPDEHRLIARFEGFEHPIDAVGYGGDVVVSEFGAGQVVRFSPDAPDDRTVVASGLAEPAGLAVDGTDLYVADRSGSIFLILDDGAALDAPRPVASGLAGPEGMAAAGDGTLYVAESDEDRVTRVDPQTGTTERLAGGLALRGLERAALGESTSVGVLSGVAVGGDGALFVSGYRENRIYRIEP